MSSLASVRPSAGASVEFFKPKPETLENLHDSFPNVCYPDRSCLCKEKVRSLVVFPIW